MKASPRPAQGRPLARWLAAPLLLAGLASAGGCADSDACKGRSETCLSVTLYGEGVTRADQLQVMLMRKAKPDQPVMALGSPQDLPFKVAVLWPDGPATLSVRAMLEGQLAGVSPELALDLRNGQHLQRKITLYPPLPGTEAVDMASHRRDLSTPPDLAKQPPDMTEVPDLLETPDLSTPLPPDLSTPLPPDLSTPLPPDLSVPAPTDL